MKAIVFHGIGDIRLDEVAEPKLKDKTDAIVRITSSAICGTDLHMVRGTLPGMKSGTVLGHEGVGVVEEIGKGIRNLQVGDRVVIPSTIACGACSYCRAGYQSQCDRANPGGPLAGTAFFGGPKASGPFDGLQAEYARVPFAHAGLVKLPPSVSDSQAILLSDIFPTAYMGAELAEIRPGNTVVIFGCGPVGLLAIVSAQLKGADRIFAVDRVPSRLAMARTLGAEAVNFDEEDPVEILRELTNGVGPDPAIDCVGVDAVAASQGPAKSEAKKERSRHEAEVKEIAPHQNAKGDLWQPGNAPSQAISWAVKSVAKAGTVGVIGVYPETDRFFPIGEAMNRNLTLRAGNCSHRRYIPELLRIVASGSFDPAQLLSQHEPLASAITAYEAFDRREPGWIKVEIRPPGARATSDVGPIDGAQQALRS